MGEASLRLLIEACLMGGANLGPEALQAREAASYRVILRAQHARRAARLEVHPRAESLEMQEGI